VSNTWLHIEIAVFCALALLVGVLAAIALMTRIRYRVGSRHVKVLLFGVCIRRLALRNIESVSKRPGSGLAERWHSTMRPKHRMLVLRKKRGLFKNFIITPKNRYVFRTDVERALRRAGLAPAVGPGESLASEDSSSEDSAPSSDMAQTPAANQNAAGN
jgi:hypothetical protein